MAARTKYTTSAPTVVYQSERITVTRYARDEFGLSLDGAYVKTFETQDQAEHAGAVWVDEQARALAADLADEAAEPWQCQSCPESDPAQRDPSRPTHCLSCPTRTYTVEHTDREVIVSRFENGTCSLRRRYTSDAAGDARAARYVAELQDAGYVLAGPWDDLPTDFPGGDDPDDGPYERHPAAAAPQGAPPSPAGPGALAPVVAGAAAEGSPRARYLARAAQARAAWAGSAAPLRWGVRQGTRTVAYRRDQDAAEVMAKRLREVA